MCNYFDVMTTEKARQLSPITLAFVGDAVYSLYVREKIVQSCDKKPADLQKLSVEKVSAQGQNLLLHDIECKFTEEECEIFKRGRNAKKGAKSKSASVAEYNASTGFEAVLGFLYLTGQIDRIKQLLEG